MLFIMLNVNFKIENYLKFLKIKNSKTSNQYRIT